MSVEAKTFLASLQPLRVSSTPTAAASNPSVFGQLLALRKDLIADFVERWEEYGKAEGWHIADMMAKAMWERLGRARYDGEVESLRTLGFTEKAVGYWQQFIDSGDLTLDGIAH